MRTFNRLWMHRLWLGLMTIVCALPQALAQEPATDAQRMIGTFRTSADLRVRLWADDTMLANPVGFTVDDRGRVYVAESHRIHAGVDDDRNRMFWLVDDLASRTVEDRLAMYERFADRVDGGMSYYTAHADLVRLLTDDNGDGQADRSRVFAGGFDDALDGIGSSVLVSGKDVLYTNIPSLWRLRDQDGDGVAEERESLLRGFGVRVSFFGHDLHGLTWGPDGKVYFSVGDRGFNVVSKEGARFAAPGRGAIFRCDPDGTGFEVYHTGLRNPQDLAFDDYGNLFTGDNNSDSGDRARIVYAVEGGDSGWHMGYQYLGGTYTRGPWNAEKLWHPQHEGQAAWIIPPVAWLGSGPSGIAWYPGVGLPERFDGRFLLCDFRGGASNSGVLTFSVRPKGAGFELEPKAPLIMGTLATDVAFGPDGRVYLLDWIDGWSGTGAGRIYTMEHPEAMRSDAAREVRDLLTSGFDHRSADELAQLLAHRDRRIRQRAQFELASRGGPVIDRLGRVARAGEHQLARIHALWALGRIGAASPDDASRVMSHVTALLDDPDGEIRAQAARVIGDGRWEGAGERLIEMLDRDREPSARARYFAAMALGKVGRRDAIPSLIKMLREAGDDVYLRHAAVMALSYMDDADAILAYGGDDSAAVRLGVVLVLRRHADPRITRFLNDVDALVALEAARAVHDLPIESAMPRLAAMIDDGRLVGADEALVRRVVNANFRLGGSERAADLGRFAAAGGYREALRIWVLELLADWAQPPAIDRVMGYYLPLEPRPEAEAAGALTPVMGELLADPSGTVRAKAIELAGRFDLAVDGALLRDFALDDHADERLRIEALRLIAARERADVGRLLAALLHVSNAAVRDEALTLLSNVDPGRAIDRIETVLRDGEIDEQQAAVRALGTMDLERASKLLAGQLRALAEGALPIELRVEVLEAANRHANDATLTRLREAYEATLAKGDVIERYTPALRGGDAERGRRIFFEKIEAQCVRCHKIEGQGAGEIGPDLTGIGSRRDRNYLLEAIVDPNRAIAEGFEPVLLDLKDGSTVSGTMIEETPQTIFVAVSEMDLDPYSTEGEHGADDGTNEAVGEPPLRRVEVRKERVASRRRGRSPMPEDVVTFLSLSELRDLIEFVATNQEPQTQR